MIEIEKDGEIQIIRFKDKISLLSLESLEEFRKAVAKADLDEDISVIVISIGRHVLLFLKSFAELTAVSVQL